LVDYFAMGKVILNEEGITIYSGDSGSFAWNGFPSSQYDATAWKTAVEGFPFPTCPEEISTKITCAYCSRKNDSKRETCKSCGAPL
jgi:hypothetical protein